MNGEADDGYSGSALSLSADGSRVAIGAQGVGNGAGHVRVWQMAYLPTGQPSAEPSGVATSSPSALPSTSPSGQPTQPPRPSLTPVAAPSHMPAAEPRATGRRGGRSQRPASQLHVDGDRLRGLDGLAVAQHHHDGWQPARASSETRSSSGWGVRRGVPNVVPSSQPTAPSGYPRGEPTGPSAVPSGQPVVGFKEWHQVGADHDGQAVSLSLDGARMATTADDSDQQVQKKAVGRTMSF